MKSLINFLILLLVVAALGFGAWFAVDKSLFGDAEQQVPPQEEIGIPATPPPALDTPSEISSEEAFGTTAGSGEDIVSTTSCTKAGETIGVIYDMHMDNKSTEEISQYLAGLEKFDQDEIEMFTQIAESIKNAPAEQLLSREEMINQFKQQCEAAESN
ncbi:MAG: hypothetical protein Q4G44_06550 [Alcaligenaceae bacterium]|nr:hypothetical protein [Alcaligenaceae bacterium]